MIPAMLEVLHPLPRASPPSCEQRIALATTRIRDLVGGARLQLALTIGRIVVEEIYDGDLMSWRQRGPKDASLRHLAADPRLTISASALYRAIGIYELKIRYADHPMWKMLTACHLRAVLGLPASEQTRLLDLATASAWTTQTLDQAAAASRDCHKSSRGGRPRKLQLVRAIESAERALTDDHEEEASRYALDDVPPEQRGDLLRRLHLLRLRCDLLVAALEADHPRPPDAPHRPRTAAVAENQSM